MPPLDPRDDPFGAVDAARAVRANCSVASRRLQQRAGGVDPRGIDSIVEAGPRHEVVRTVACDARNAACRRRNEERGFELEFDAEDRIERGRIAAVVHDSRGHAQLDVSVAGQSNRKGRACPRRVHPARVLVPVVRRAARVGEPKPLFRRPFERCTRGFRALRRSPLPCRPCPPSLYPPRARSKALAARRARGDDRSIEIEARDGGRRYRRGAAPECNRLERERRRRSRAYNRCTEPGRAVERKVIAAGGREDQRRSREIREDGARALTRGGCSRRGIAESCDRASRQHRSDGEERNEPREGSEVMCGRSHSSHKARGHERPTV